MLCAVQLRSAEGNPVPRRWPLVWQLTRRELAQRLGGSVLGAGWMLLHPLALLLLYGLVFEGVFRVRLPRADGTPFLLFVAVVLWPWQALSDAVSRSVTAITAQASLLRKVHLPASLLVQSVVAASFILQLTGYAVALLAMAIVCGWPLRAAGLPQVLLCLLAVYLLTVGLSCAVAALNVYLRDVEQAVPPLLALGFFLSPVLYSAEMAPPWLRAAMQLNPAASLLDGLRHAWLDGAVWPGPAQWTAIATATLIYAGGMYLLHRLEPGFDQVL